MSDMSDVNVGKCSRFHIRIMPIEMTLLIMVRLFGKYVQKTRRIYKGNFIYTEPTNVRFLSTTSFTMLPCVV